MVHTIRIRYNHTLMVQIIVPYAYGIQTFLLLFEHLRIVKDNMMHKNLMYYVVLYMQVFSNRGKKKVCSDPYHMHIYSKYYYGGDIWYEHATTTASTSSCRYSYIAVAIA